MEEEKEEMPKEETAALLMELEAARAELSALKSENEALNERLKLPTFSARTEYREDKLEGIKAIFRKK